MMFAKIPFTIRLPEFVNILTIKWTPKEIYTPPENYCKCHLSRNVDGCRKKKIYSQAGKKMPWLGKIKMNIRSWDIVLFFSPFTLSVSCIRLFSLVIWAQCNDLRRLNNLGMEWARAMQVKCRYSKVTIVQPDATISNAPSGEIRQYLSVLTRKRKERETKNKLQSWSIFSKQGNLMRITMLVMLIL